MIPGKIALVIPRTFGTTAKSEAAIAAISVTFRSNFNLEI
jgi:hypothetical protein